MFGRATITLGIGPHSTWLFFRQQQKFYVIVIVESFGDTIRDGLQELAYRATGMDPGHSDVTFETVSSVSRFPNYRPVVIPASGADRQFSPAEALKNKTSLSKTPASQNFFTFLLLSLKYQ